MTTVCVDSQLLHGAYQNIERWLSCVRNSEQVNKPLYVTVICKYALNYICLLYFACKLVAS